MSEISLLTIACALVAAMFGVLCAIIAWMGNRMYEALQNVGKKLENTSETLHNRITGIDKRLVAVEARCNMHHMETGQ